MATQATVNPVILPRDQTSRRRLDALMETIGGLLLLLGINAAWYPDDLGWLDASLHPFFIVVLLIASRYGTIDGLVAGFAAALLHVGFRFTRHPEAFLGLTTLMDLELMRSPYLFVLLGTIIGEVRQVADDEASALRRQLREVGLDLASVSHETLSVRRLNDDLQERIASETQTPGAFYEAAATMQTLREDDVLPAVLDIVNKMLGSDKSAIYMRGSANWELRAQVGWDAPDEFRRTLPLDSPMLRRVEGGEVVTLRDATDVEGSGIVLAAPIVNDDGSGATAVRAAITVQQIPLTSLNHGTVRNLSGIASWASKVLSGAEQFERVRERDPSDETTGTYRYPYLLRRLDEECGRWKRYKTPVSLVVFRIVNFERVPRKKRAAFLYRVGRMLLRHVRAVDLVARWKSADMFALVLPSTDADGARILAGRINEHFAREVLQDVPRTAEITLEAGLGSGSLHGDTREELVRAAERLEIGT